MVSNFEVDTFVEKLAMKSIIKSFYPVAISKSLNVPLNQVVDRLNFLVNGGSLVLKYEVRCSDDLTILDIIDDYSDILGEKVYCRECNDEIEIGMENIFPVYYINEVYREHVKKNSTLDQKNGTPTLYAGNDSVVNIEEIVRQYFISQGVESGTNYFESISRMDSNLGKIASILSYSGDKEVIEKLKEADNTIEKAIDIDSKAVIDGYKSNKKGFNVRFDEIGTKAGHVVSICAALDLMYQGAKIVSTNWPAIEAFLKSIKIF